MFVFSSTALFKVAVDGISDGMLEVSSILAESEPLSGPACCGGA